MTTLVTYVHRFCMFCLSRFLAIDLTCVRWKFLIWLYIWAMPRSRSALQRMTGGYQPGYLSC